MKVHNKILFPEKTDHDITRSLRIRKAEKIAALCNMTRYEVLAKWDKSYHYCKKHGWFKGTRCKPCRENGK